VVLVGVGVGVGVPVLVGVAVGVGVDVLVGVGVLVAVGVDVGCGTQLPFKHVPTYKVVSPEVIVGDCFAQKLLLNVLGMTKELIILSLQST
jgi:hypothetical protein